MHVLVVEYPGYGMYKTCTPNEQMMREDAETVFDYLTTICGVKPSDIILFGRSMGSGPTSYLASVRKCHCAVIMSGYTSIKDVAKSYMGYASFISFLVVERFRNIDYISKS